MSRSSGSHPRGEIWRAELGEPRGSEPGFRRPVLIIQDDSFNQSGIRTVLVAVITGNLRLTGAPGNVLLSTDCGLERESVINVSQIFTLDRHFSSKLLEVSRAARAWR